MGQCCARSMKRCLSERPTKQRPDRRGVNRSVKAAKAEAGDHHATWPQRLGHHRLCARSKIQALALAMPSGAISVLRARRELVDHGSAHQSAEEVEGKAEATCRAAVRGRGPSAASVRSS